MSSYEELARLSDAERTAALNQLAEAVGQGRLSIADFEDRSDDILRAQTRQELVPILIDVPAVPTTEAKVYSISEVERARDAARKPRLATALIGTLGLGFGSIVLMTSPGSLSIAAGAIGGIGLLFLIPVLWIMLYVAKIGPSSWNMPSPRQIERQRQREIQSATAMQRAHQKEIEAQMWAQRRQEVGEIAGEAMSLARRKFDQWNKR